MSKEILSLYKTNNLLKAKEEVFNKLAMISNIAMDATKISMAKSMFDGKTDNVNESNSGNIGLPPMVAVINNSDIVPLSESKKTTTIIISDFETRKDKEKIDDILQDYDHDIDGDKITLNISDMSKFRAELKRSGVKL